MADTVKVRLYKVRCTSLLKCFLCLLLCSTYLVGYFRMHFRVFGSEPRSPSLYRPLGGDQNYPSLIEAAPRATIRRRALRLDGADQCRCLLVTEGVPTEAVQSPPARPGARAIRATHSRNPLQDSVIEGRINFVGQHLAALFFVFSKPPFDTHGPCGLS